MSYTYKRRFGDRKDGRLIRSLPAMSKLLPFLMPRRDDASNQFSDQLEITEAEAFLDRLNSNGHEGLSMLHFVLAVYVRCLSLMPALNRFVVGRRIFARNGIDVVFALRRGEQEELIKVRLDPNDTIFDIQRKMNAKIEEIRVGDDTSRSGMAELVDVATKLPRFVTRIAIALMKLLDYFGVAPASILQESPFYASLSVTDLGGLRMKPAQHSLPSYGNLPVTLSLGDRRTQLEVTEDGQLEKNRYIDFISVVDKRIADGPYLAKFYKGCCYLFENPQIVESAPAKVTEDLF